MPYVTQAQLQDRFGAGDLKQWTDDDASGAVDASVVGSIIADVGAMIDAAASQHYTAPLSLGNATTAAVVRDMAGSLAGYRLATRRHADNVPENLRLLYDDALKWLQRLEQGKVSLAGETEISAPKPSGGIVVAGGSVVVDRDSMDGL